MSANSIRDRLSGTVAVPGQLLRRGLESAEGDPRRAVRLLGVAVLGAALLVALLGWQTWRQQRSDEARQQASAVASQSVVKLLSYNYTTIDHQVADTQGLLTGSFKDSYAALVRNTIADAAKAQQVAIQTQVVSDSVVSSSPDQVVLLMYVNQQSEAAAKPNPDLSGSRLRLTLLRESGKWLVSELAPV